VKSLLGLFLAILILAFAGCAPRAKGHSGSYHVRIPMDDGHGHYSFQDVELKTIYNLETMSGAVARFKTKGNVQMGDGGVAFYDEGFTPTAHFIESDGSYVPTDYWSTAMAATYYHLERIKEFFDKFGGNAAIQFPRTVLIDLDTLEVKNGVMALPGINNAMYLSRLDVFALSKYEDRGLVPLAFNGGVLTHEYFHSVFNRHQAKWFQVHQNSRDKYQPESKENRTSLINTFIMRSLDEGIADFFGADYSGNPAFEEASLEKKLVGGRDASQLKVFNDGPSHLFKAFRENGDKVAVDYYGLGSAISSYLWELGKKWKDPAALHAIILNAVDIYLEQVFKSGGKDIIDFGRFGLAVLKAKADYFSTVQKASFSPVADCHLAFAVFRPYLDETEFKQNHEEFQQLCPGMGFGV